MNTLDNDEYDKLSALLSDTLALLSEAREWIENYDKGTETALRLLVAIEQHEDRLALEGY